MDVLQKRFRQRTEAGYSVSISRVDSTIVDSRQSTPDALGALLMLISYSATQHSSRNHFTKSLVGNKGYRRYLKFEGSGHFVIDEKQLKADQRYDGMDDPLSQHKRRSLAKSSRAWRLRCIHPASLRVALGGPNHYGTSE